VSGTIYYQQPDAMCMLISEPVNQWIFSGKDTMVLFYPDDSLAFKFHTIYPVTFPFFQAFLGIVQEDYGLTAIGYTLAEHEVTYSILTTIWAPPKNAPPDIGRFCITYTNERLTGASYLSADSSVISRTQYRDHFAYGAYFFPMEIEKIQFAEQDTIRELITYTNPQFNCELPDSLMNFRLPGYVTIEQIQW
jgi:outer membrane lipoprotein-sorting protein